MPGTHTHSKDLLQRVSKNINLPCSKMVGLKIGKEQTQNQFKKKKRKKRKKFQRQNNILNSNKIFHEAMPATDSSAGCALHRGALAAGAGGAQTHPKLCTGAGGCI